MSVAAPKGALDALLSRTCDFAGREVSLTMGALLAVESLAPAERKIPRIVAWTALAVSEANDAEIYAVIRALRTRQGIVPYVLNWASNLTLDAREKAVSVAERLMDDYDASRCVYTDASGNAPEPVQCGNAIALAGFFMIRFGLTFEQFFTLPATRANALHAAWCEANGMAGKDTFWSREMLAAAPEIMAKMDFGWAGKTPAEKRN